MMASHLNYLIYHPEPERRAALRQTLEQALGSPCLGEGSDLPSAPPQRLGPLDLVVFHRPEPRGRVALRVVRRWREGKDAPQMLVLIEPDEAALVRPLLDCGVAGFLTPQAAPEEFSAAVAALAHGGAYISGKLLRVAFAPHRRAEGNEGDAFGLTTREREILVMIALGLSNKDVARRLSLSVRTVETHRLNIRKKTRASSRRDLVEIAEKLGLLIEYGSQHGLAERRAAPGFHEG
jgi:two-component system, NarL family, nitrate/nitrite response regulator NarL